MKSTLTGLVRVGKSDAKQATGALTAAFFDYPLMEYIFPSEAERKKGLPNLFQYYLYYAFRYGEVYTTSSNFEGVTVWMPSDNYPMNLWRLIRSVPLPVVLGMGSVANKRMQATDGYMDALHRRFMTRRHWYLGALGVVPECQGKGYASELLYPMLRRTEKEGLPCYLETQIAARVGLYQHFGFKVIDESEIPNTGITSWAMVKEPRVQH